MLELIAKALGLISSWTDYASKRLTLKNSAPMQSAAQAQDESARISKVETAVAKQDTAAIRNELAE